MHSSTAILFATHFFNEEVLLLYRKLRDEVEGMDGVDGKYDVFLLLETSDGAEPPLPKDVRCFPFSMKSLKRLGFKPIAKTLLPGSNHFPVWLFRQAHREYRYYWNIEYDVRFSGHWNDFFAFFQHKKEDFLASHIGGRGDNPDWPHWHLLHLPEMKISEADLLKSFNPVYRISDRAMDYIGEILAKGGSGHHEVLLPTLLKHGGFSLADLGGTGKYAYPEKPELFYTANKAGDTWYKSSTMRYRPPYRAEEMCLENRLYHPIKPALRHAVLILAHKNMEHICRLVSFFKERCDVFVHLDRKSSFTPQEIERLTAFPQVRGVYRKYAVHWGGFSILKCELFLLKEAMEKSDAAYFHLLSGQDYPIRPLSDMLDFFEENRGTEFMSFTHLPSLNWEHCTFDRLTYFYFFDWLERGGKAFDFTRKSILFQRRWGIRRPVPLHFDHIYGGSQWFSITREAVGELLRYTRKHPRLYRRLRFSFAPDETYVTTVLVNRMPHEKIQNRNLRFIRWRNENGSSPANLSMEHLYHLLRSRAFFARKFDTCSKQLLDLIDQRLLPSASVTVSSTGGWRCDGFAPYRPDPDLAKSLLRFCRAECIDEALEMGCGTGLNVATLRLGGIAAAGYDANPHTPELSALLLPKGDDPCGIADLTDDFSEEPPHPLVLCLDVCGYIPEEYHERVVRNLAMLTGSFLVVSWTAPGRMGDGGARCYPRTEEEVVEMFRPYGLDLYRTATSGLRENTSRPFLKRELLVFRRI